MKQNNNVTSVDRVFQIVETLASYPNGCSLAVLSEEIALSKSTIHRFLKTLQQLGYVSIATVEGSYRLSFKIANIGQKLIHETNVVQLALPELTRLRNRTKETVNFKNFHETHDVIVFKLEPKSGNFRTRTYIGQSFPSYCTATGTIFLAYRGEKFVRNYWKTQKKVIQKITDTTITDLGEFLKKCDKARKQGFAMDNEENELGISCIAAPVFDINGDVNYAISISLQTVKLANVNQTVYIEPLLECAQKLSEELGYEEQIQKMEVKTNEVI